jgi:hypothetical protein
MIIFHTSRSANDGNHRNCTLGTVYRCPLSGKPDIEPDIAAGPSLTHLKHGLLKTFAAQKDCSFLR